MKKIQATSNELRNDYRCKRYKCFEINSEEWHRIIKDFNNLGEYNRQNAFLK